MASHPRKRLRQATLALLLCLAALALVDVAVAQEPVTTPVPQEAPTPLALPAATEAPSDGQVGGLVYDSLTGSTIGGATVEVVGRQKRVKTDKVGKFALTLPAGSYKLRISALEHDSRVITVDVVAGETLKAEAALAQQSSVLDVTEVVADSIKGSAAALRDERQQSVTVSENISAETIQQSPDSDAAEVVQRMSGVTVKNDKYIVVRGLGERYSSALLDGSRLPSTNPDKRVVSLDLFPSEFIESLSIAKTYSPDLPGDFSGGLVDIRLKSFPEEWTATLGTTTTGNTEATFQDFDTYEGSNVDYFGFGAGFRERPGILPDEVLQPTAPPTDAQQRSIHNKFRNIWTPDSKTAPIGFGLNGSIGNSYGPFGFSLSGTYGNDYKVRRNERQVAIQNPEVFDGGTFEGTDFTYDRSTFETKLGALLTAGYQINDDHNLNLRSFVNRSSTDETRVGKGLNTNLDAEGTTFQNVLQYREEQLGFGQLAGEHLFSIVEVDWRTALSQTTRDEPDTRYVRRRQGPGQPAPVLVPSFQPSLLRTFVDLSEYMTDSAVDFTVPFSTRLPYTDVWRGLEAKLKTGLAYTYREREMEFRRYNYNEGNTSGIDLSLPVEQLLVAANVGTPQRNAFEFNELTRPSDSFDASQEIAALYGMLELPIIGEQLRVVGGARLEYSYIRSDGFDAADSSKPANARINDLNPLPAVNVVYSPLDDMNVRLGYSRTTSRPEFRELTPTEFPVPDGERAIVGTPNLASADIDSADVRWEWFFTEAEVVSASVFYKDMRNVVEQVSRSRSASTVDSFQNADAEIYGLELEAQKSLDFASDWARKVDWLQWLAPELPNVMLATNAAVIDSTATIKSPPASDCLDPTTSPPECRATQTNSKRALQGQPPFSVNTTIEYTNETWGTYRLLYNTVGERIIAAGTDGLDDIVEKPRDQLDLVWTNTVHIFDTPVKAKFAIENVLNDPYRASQGGLTTARYELGTKFSLGFSYSF